MSRYWLELARAEFGQAKNGMGPTHLRLAAEALEIALHLSPRDADTWAMAADTYHELGRSNFTFVLRAIECCRASLRFGGPSTP